MQDPTHAQYGLSDVMPLPEAVSWCVPWICLLLTLNCWSPLLAPQVLLCPTHRLLLGLDITTQSVMFCYVQSLLHASGLSRTASITRQGGTYTSIFFWWFNMFGISLQHRTFVTDDLYLIKKATKSNREMGWVHVGQAGGLTCRTCVT